MAEGRAELAIPDTPVSPEPEWVEVTAVGDTMPAPTRLSWWPMVIQMVVAAVLVIAFVAVVGAAAARKVAEADAVEDALKVSNLLARTAVVPALSDALLDEPSDAVAAALARLDAVVRQFVLSGSLIRVKLWTPDGRVVYSDEPRLLGQIFPLDGAELEALRTQTLTGSVSNLSAPENQYERSQGKLLEVYCPVRLPSGQPLLFETYYRYGEVLAHSGRVWRSFAAITVGSLLLIHVLYVPLVWVLVGRLRRARRQRDLLLASALSASDEERRRIAGTLHDGVVQDLAATSFVVSGSAEQARDTGESQLANRLDAAAAGVRASIGSLRTLLVDIYPPNLRQAGLYAALMDLAAPLQARGVDVTVTAVGELNVDHDVATLIYRVAQECLRNTDRHARAERAHVLVRQRSDRVVLDVLDNGHGFDPHATLKEPVRGHFGVHVMRDLATARGARLAVATAPGAGTHWRLEVATGAA